MQVSGNLIIFRVTLLLFDNLQGHPPLGSFLFAARGIHDTTVHSRLPKSQSAIQGFAVTAKLGKDSWRNVSPASDGSGSPRIQFPPRKQNTLQLGRNTFAL